MIPEQCVTVITDLSVNITAAFLGIIPILFRRSAVRMSGRCRHLVSRSSACLAVCKVLHVGPMLVGHERRLCMSRFGSFEIARTSSFEPKNRTNLRAPKVGSVFGGWQIKIGHMKNSSFPCYVSSVKY